MKIEHLAAFAPKTRHLAEEILRGDDPCLGCSDCRGLCVDILQVATLPDVILKGATS